MWEITGSRQNKKNMMKIIGITGGVGSGKSRVLSYIEEISAKKNIAAVICQADHVAWELQKPGNDCYQKIVAHFGTEILNADLTINRKLLGQIVFHDEKELLLLNEITHPAVKCEITDRIRGAEKSGIRLFVLEAALLIEEHYDEICDELWYIYTDVQIRRQRLKESRQYTDEKIDAIISTQLSEETFRKKCNRIIENSGDFDLTQNQIEQAIKELERITE